MLLYWSKMVQRVRITARLRLGHLIWVVIAVLDSRGALLRARCRCVRESVALFSHRGAESARIFVTAAIHGISTGGHLPGNHDTIPHFARRDCCFVLSQGMCMTLHEDQPQDSRSAEAWST